jgi:hypothetical protein
LSIMPAIMGHFFEPGSTPKTIVPPGVVDE